jgi:radical SAM protein with 4Fe4S-binding SPASM domain
MLNKTLKDFASIKDSKYNFVSYFDSDTGFYVRTGILDSNGVDTGVNPFMASFPQLLDIGLMGHCSHGLSGLCKETGIQCYQSGMNINQPNMLYQEFKHIADESEGKVFQFALGGRGDPELHENFEKILEYCREKNIVPNITTSGYLLTKEKAAIIKEYCGAAAVSWYRKDYSFKAINLLLDSGIKTNIHFVIGNDSIDEAIDLLENEKFPKGINRVIFLLFKPVGQGSLSNILLSKDKRTKYFFNLMNKPNIQDIAGYDSCCIPGIVNYSYEIDPDSFDTCEGSRFSAYITPDMKILPCSFDQDMRWAVDLNNKTIEEAWKDPIFDDFRTNLKNACNNCEKSDLCLGGCPIKPEIVLCEKKVKFNNKPVSINKL